MLFFFIRCFFFMKTDLLSSLYSALFKMSFKHKSLGSKVVNCLDCDGDDHYHHLHSKSGSSNIPNMSLLDLPDLVLDCIIERLPPEGLRSMASVCSSMQERWISHMNHKWRKVVGPAAYGKWQLDIVYEKESSFFNPAKEKGLINYLSKLWPIALVRSSCNNNRSNSMRTKNYNPIDSVMYLALESGKFWFPAQVYKRENGHFGFMLSCYDAELRYDRKTDTFQARYPPHLRNEVSIETGVTWDRVRSVPIDTSPLYIHTSDCLNELRPGDHIEIQWRRNRRCPFGWWYGVVGHLEQCNGGNYCRCPESVIMLCSTNMPLVQGGEKQLSVGKTIKKKGMQRMDFTVELGSLKAMEKYPSGIIY
ncbi:hypothetical protein Leryth_008338 [Lithospermum erythrorhizon]|nr:hypothetical protein Leryth_008338 [Lithospermum erythrorhizon]